MFVSALLLVSCQIIFFAIKKAKGGVIPFALVSYSFSSIIGCSISYIIGIPISVAI